MRNFLFALLLIASSSPVLAAMTFVPSQFDPVTAKVIVAIHGCMQSAEAMALGTGWNEIAESNNLVILYPQVPAGSHPMDCWSWYDPANQRSDSGQLKDLVSEIDGVKSKLGLSPSAATFVLGISSGATTAAGLLACFPENFKGGAIHSGPAYGLAQSPSDAVQILKNGPPSTRPQTPCDPANFKGGVFVIQGLADTVVNPQHGQRVISEFSSNTKCEFYLVPGLGHAWSGSIPATKMSVTLPFFSQTGPNATARIWNFFNSL